MSSKISGDLHMLLTSSNFGGGGYEHWNSCGTHIFLASVKIINERSDCVCFQARLEPDGKIQNAYLGDEN
jgi:hypothetical protein